MGASTAIPLSSFLLACLLSTWPGNALVRFIYDLILRSARSPVAGLSMREWLGGRAADRDLAEFRSSTAWVIGTLERIIIIYALGYSQQNFITSVIILKAFFAWTQPPARPGATPPQEAAPEEAGTAETRAQPGTERLAMLEVIAHYHTYIIGNFLSLLIAIGLYAAAQGLFPQLIANIPVDIAWLKQVLGG